MLLPRSFLLLVAFLFYADSLCSQDFNLSDLSNLAEELFLRQDGEVSYEEFYDQLLLRYHEPLDLNLASMEELRSLHVLNESQIEEMIRHRESSGPWVSILELQGLTTFDVFIIDRIRAFIRVQELDSRDWIGLVKRMKKLNSAYLIYRSDGNVLTRLSSQTNSKSDLILPGSPWSGSFRFRTSKSNDYSIGWNLEKDRGERFIWNPRQRIYGFDFHSFHLQIQNKPAIQNLILGDYTASFGQGLIFGGGFGVGKGSETITTIRRATIGFKPYSSMTEYGFLRGFAWTMPLGKRFTSHILISRNFNDGEVQFDQDSVPIIRSIVNTGIHRSPEEINRRKVWSEKTLGSVFQFKTKSVDGGLLFQKQVFSVFLNPKLQLYNAQVFRGSKNSNLGAFLNTRYRNWTFFSEWASSLPSGGTAWIGGVLGALSGNFDISLLARNYSPDFHSFHGSAFSENTTSTNEQGLYVGWKYRKGKKHQWTGYSDHFRFPQLKFRVYKPSEGVEHMVRYSGNFTRKHNLTIQIRQVRKERNASNPSSVFYENIELIRTVTSVQFDYPLSQYFSGRTKWMAIQIQEEKEVHSGSMLLQDLFYKYGRLTISLRYSIFASDDYESRLFAYERDVWLSYSFPSWYGYGIRTYVLAQYQMGEKFTAWLKWSAVQYSDNTPSENGLDEHSESIRADLRIQLRWLF